MTLKSDSRKIILVMIILAVPLLVAGSPMPQRDAPPMRQDAFISLLKQLRRGDSQAPIVNHVRGVDFELTADAEAELLSAGARPELMAVRDKFRGAATHVAPAGSGANKSVAPKKPSPLLKSSATPSYTYLFSFRHDDIVTCADFSRDGRWLATGSEVGSLLVTDLQSHNETKIKNGDSEDNGIQALRFSQDGQLLLVGGFGNKDGRGQIRVLRASDYASTASFDMPGSKAVTYLDISSDNKWLIAANQSDALVWNLQDRNIAWKCSVENSVVSFDGDQALMIAGPAGDLALRPGQVAFFNITNGRMVRSLQTTITETIRRIVPARAKTEIFALTDNAIVYRLSSHSGEIKQRISLAKVDPRVISRGIQLWDRTDFEVLRDYPILAFNDRRTTFFLNYESGKTVPLEHGSMVGLKINESGNRFVLLGGVKDGSLRGVPPEHYWTVNVFSFEHF